METHRLICHPDMPPIAVTSVEARIVSRDENWLRLRWRIEGSEKLYVPPFGGKGRADNLWQTTCFEAFVMPLAGLMAGGSGAYVELNLSPSEHWAAYDFSSRREGMTNRPFPREPVCTMRQGSTFAIFDAAVPASALPAPPWRYALTAVIEEEGGIKSLWAMRHGSGKPDFHDPACFTGTFAAPETT